MNSRLSILVLVIAITFSAVVGLAQNPQVISTVPSLNELNVSVSANVAVTFDMDMDAATINNSTFKINGNALGPYSGNIIYDVSSRTATFDPINNFAVGEIISVILTNGIQSITGFPLLNGYIWLFTADTESGTAIFADEHYYSTGYQSNSICKGDFDSDGDIDIALTNHSSDSISVLFNDGIGVFNNYSYYGVNFYSRNISSADCDGDGDMDLVTNDQDSISILYNNGDGSFSNRANYFVGGNPLAMFVADLDGDGDIDIGASKQAYDFNVSILLNDGNGAFSLDSTYILDEVYSICGGDIDNDGDIDIAAALFGLGNVTILINDGNGTFGNQSSYSVGDNNNPAFVTVADLNGDNYVDLAAANNWSNSISVLLNDGSGAFHPSTEYQVIPNPTSIYAADYDNDGDIDMASAGPISIGISLLRNYGNGAFADQVVYPPLAERIIGADFDEDGDIDLAGYDSNVIVVFNWNGCEYVVGDINGSGNFDGLDIVYSVNFFKGGSVPPIVCECPHYDPWLTQGDVNASCTFNGLDVTYGFTFFKGGQDPIPCADCPPAR